MVMELKKDENFAEKLNDRLLKARKPLITLLIALIVVIVGLVTFVLVTEGTTKKALAQLDEIYFALTTDVASVSEEDLAAREAQGLESLKALAAKSGAVGSRANLLVAEIQFQKKDFAAAREAWLLAANAKKNAYTAPLSYFNAAVCSESLGDLDAAVQYYTAASDSKDFLLVDHALFSLGRVNEAKGDFEAAKAAYEKLTAAASGSSWTNLAKTRLLALQIAGSIQ